MPSTEAIRVMQDRIAGLEFLLANYRNDNPDTATARVTRVLAEESLARSRRMLARLEAGESQASFTEFDPSATCITGDAQAGNLNFNACFMGVSTTVTMSGRGSIYQRSHTALVHGANTVLILDGNFHGSPIESTNQFGSVNPFSFELSKVLTYTAPLCVAASHTLKAQTTHTIGLEIMFGLGFQGSMVSRDSVSCVRKFLTVVLDPTEVGTNQNFTVTVGHLPPGGCALTMSSSNESVAQVEQEIEDYKFLGSSGVPGTTTITAKCADQTAGSAVLKVTQVMECDESDWVWDPESSECVDCSETLDRIARRLPSKTGASIAFTTETANVNGDERPAICDAPPPSGGGGDGDSNGDGVVDTHDWPDAPEGVNWAWCLFTDVKLIEVAADGTESTIWEGKTWICSNEA